MSTFANDLTSKKAKNHKIGIHFSTSAIVALWQNFGGYLVFDFRK